MQVFLSILRAGTDAAIHKILVLKHNSNVVPMCLNYVMNVSYINRKTYGLGREFLFKLVCPAVPDY
jgi:hypothetical protein